MRRSIALQSNDNRIPQRDYFAHDHLHVLDEGLRRLRPAGAVHDAQLVSLVHTHRLSLATVAVLLFFLLVMNLALVVGMRWLHADRLWSAQYAGYGAVMASD